MLVRPASVGLDDMERPRVLSDLLEAIGAKAVESPLTTECCGSYHAVNEEDTAAEYASRILGAASARGAEVIVSSCPLCVYNLDSRQAATRRKHPALKAVPVLYFTQILGLALGVPEADLGLESMAVDPRFALAGLAATAR
jgi:heterodisulfide reductase subunit B